MSPHLSQQNLNSNHLPRPENKLFYPAIDGLRAVAAILVFLQHYVLYRFNPIVTWGWTGVDIFFVLSGFLITGILFDTQNDPHRFRTFYIRRALRIFPLYFGVFRRAAYDPLVSLGMEASIASLSPIFRQLRTAFLAVCRTGGLPALFVTTGAAALPGPPLVPRR